MGDQNVTSLWDGNVESPEPPLRRPNNRSSLTNSTVVPPLRTPNLSDSFDNAVTLRNEDSILSTSKLSVDAKEWFPKDFIKDNTTDYVSSKNKSVQGRLARHKIVESPANEISNELTPIETKYEDDDDEFSHGLLKLQSLIGALIDDPGLYDEVLDTFIDTLGPFYEDVNFVANLTNLIFSQAVDEPNFRYNAARLCSIVQDECPLFRSNLHMLCDSKVHDTTPDANLALFLAELYSQLNYDDSYGCLLIDILKTLSETEANIKSVCQILKLTGSSLESYNKDAINDIFKRLDQNKHKLTNTNVNLLNSVMSLRASNWGRVESSPVDTTSRMDEFHPTHDGPIFYGPDGQELTEEERQFLADNCSYQSDFTTDDSDVETVWEVDPEMTEEIQAAFQQFIKHGK